MTVVVDASVAVRWIFELPGSDLAERFFQAKEPLIAPDLVIAEIANAAWKLVRFERFDAGLARRGLDDAARLISEIVPCATLKDRAFAIALDLRHPVYDCFYLALCEVRACCLASFDARLIRRCAGTPYAALLAPAA